MSDVVEFPKQDYDDIKCCDCAFTFAVPPAFRQGRIADHKLFWCPQCGTVQQFLEPEVVKLRRRVAELEAQLAGLQLGRRLTFKEQVTGHIDERSRR